VKPVTKKLGVLLKDSREQQKEWLGAAWALRTAVEKHCYGLCPQSIRL